jgi:nucleoporin NDC1
MAVMQPKERLMEHAYTVVRSAVIRAAGAFLVNWLLYAFVLKNWVWTASMYVTKIRQWDMPMSSEPSTWRPYHYKVLWHSTISGILLLAFWETCNVIFDVYLAQPPVKSGVPLTNGCRVPNGNLLNGLSSRKELVRVGLIAAVSNDKRY